MLTQIRSQLVHAPTCESAFAELCLQSPLCPMLVNPSPSSEMARLSHGIQDLTGIAMSGAIDRIGFRQSPFNPHTSTALAAYCKSLVPYRQRSA